jgi:dye decolorizing peroxidase
MALSRRRFLAGAGRAAGAVAVPPGLAGCGDSHATAQLPDVSLPAAKAGLTVRQHAWQATLSLDQYGNPVAPTFDRLLFFDIKGTPTPAHVRILEAGLRHLEDRYAWGPHGLLFTAGWGHAYFAEVLKRAAPIPAATALSTVEAPTFDSYHLCLHLACDDERRLAQAQLELLRGPHAITAALAWRETRTGFNGAGLPARHQDVTGIPGGDPVPVSAPLYMGFSSNLKGNQATEDAVTIPSGPFAEGTTMAVSYMTLSLESWYGELSEEERVQRMYSPQTTLADQRAITTEAEGNPDKLNQAINHYGVIGHSQSSARARRNNQAIILRRDFDSTDGGQAGLHFVSLQRDVEDFVATRTQMNQAGASLQNPAITETTNNGINEFIFVLRRGNYMLPSRAQRSFPQLPGRAAALDKPLTNPV